MRTRRVMRRRGLALVLGGALGLAVPAWGQPADPPPIPLAGWNCVICRMRPCSSVRTPIMPKGVDPSVAGSSGASNCKSRIKSHSP